MSGSARARRKSITALALCFTFGLNAVTWGEDSSASGYDSNEHKSYIGEATRAVVGRVFGVEGEASDIRYHEIELTSHSPGNAAIRSLFVPGWGQYFNRQRVKGSVLFLSTIGAAIASVHLYDQSRDSYDHYKAKGVKDDPSYDNYIQQRTRAFVFGGAAIVLWIATIVDAHQNAYTPLYSKSYKVDVALDERGANIRFRKNL